MPRTRTLLQLRTECRQRTEMEGSAFVSDAELTRYVNQSIAKLYGKLVRARGEHYYRTTNATATIAGGATVDLPTNFFKLMGVDVYLSGVWRAIDPMDWSQRARYQNANSGAWAYDTEVVYDFTGNKLAILPLPTAAYPVNIHYLPHATELALDADVFDGINGWEAYAVADASIAMLGKEEGDTRALMAELAGMDKLIDELANSRDDGTAWRVSRRWRSGSGRGY